jgi:hypothetical protein
MKFEDEGSNPCFSRSATQAAAARRGSFQFGRTKWQL